MSQYAGTPKLATTLPVPDANTPFNASAINAPIKAEWDSILAIKQYGFFSETLNTVKPPYPLAGNHENTGTYRLNGSIVLVGTSTVTFDSPRSYRLPCKIAGPIDLSKWGPSSVDPNAFPHQIMQTAALNVSNPNEHLRYECDVPPGGSLVNVTVWVQPSTGHGALPTNRPQLIVWIYDSDTGLATQTGAAAVANAGTIGAYEMRTLLTVTAGANTIAVPQKVVLQVYGESGVGSQVGLVVDEPSFTFSVPGMKTP